MRCPSLLFLTLPLVCLSAAACSSEPGSDTSGTSEETQGESTGDEEAGSGSQTSDASGTTSESGDGDGDESGDGDGDESGNGDGDGDGGDGDESGDGDDELCGHGGLTPPPEPDPGSAPGMASAAGVGALDDIVLGALVDDSVVQPAPAAWAVDYTIDLDAQTYDVYVPPEYDGSEPYGLITFINSGNNGGQPNGSYLDLLSEHKLIWIAADGVGNSITVDLRMGPALLGAHRARELWNIDDTRVYSMGNSGGARSANMMAFLHPEFFDSTMPRCGANYIAQVEQAYETQEPDGHYEFWGAQYFPDVDGQPYRDWLLGFDQKFALMTSRSDFREGDMMNIYHFGYEADGFESRFLDIAGGHCATNAGHFRDAVNFVEHPMHLVIDEAFADDDLATNPDAGDGMVTVAGTPSEANTQLRLSPGSGVAFRNRLHFGDAKGAILRTQLASPAGENTRTLFGVWPYDAADHAGAPSNMPHTPADLESRAGLMMVVSNTGSTGEVQVWLGSGSSAVQVFSATFSDWDASVEPLPFKLQVWDSELQINLGKHVQDAQAEIGTLLLNDQRTVRVRFEEFEAPANWWPEGTWSADEGAVLTVSSAADAGGPSALDYLSLKDAAGILCD